METQNSNDKFSGKDHGYTPQMIYNYLGSDNHGWLRN
jgi:hypothetical protein